MKALSIHQPWAWAILHAGKCVENRKWRTNHRGPLIIHASKSRASYAAQDLAVWRERYGVELPAWDELVTGAIVGVVEVIDCVPVGDLSTSSPWAFGPWCWVLENPRAFQEPVPWKGQLSLYQVPESVLLEEFK